MSQPIELPLSERRARVPAGALVSLLVWAALAPAGARAGCSYPGGSHVEPALLPSIVRETVAGRVGSTVSPASSPIPPSPGPCRGAWCRGGTDVPAVPAGTFRIRAEHWAWSPAVPGPDRSMTSQLFTDTTVSSPASRAADLFRPPRPRAGA